MPKNVSAALRPTLKWPLLAFLLIWTAFGLYTCTEGSKLTGNRSVSTLGVAGERTPLDEYVEGRDRKHSYRVVQTLPNPSYNTYMLEMTSQTWLTPKQVDRVLWKHWLTIVVPENVTSNTALLHLTGGDNDHPVPKRANSVLVGIAVETHSIVASLRMVPNQPLTFVGDEHRSRSEDSLIAYAWDKFLKGGNPVWLPRLPMTTSAIQAMDTAVSFLRNRDDKGLEIDGFVVTGASKRGWTTWTTAAVDPRVVAIVPIVSDFLNLEASFQHHFSAYGFWAEAIRDYVDMGIPDWIGTEEMTALTEIVDPYTYRSRLTMPKFMINASGDEFFLPDSSQFYFNDLPGEKYVRYVPNTGHSLSNTDATDSLLAYYEAITTGTPRPRFTWSLKDEDSIYVQTDESTTPSQVLLWQAFNSEARDFRFSTIGDAWTSSAVDNQGQGLYVATIEKPTSGWTAFFVELTYSGSGTTPFKFTTQVRVVPSTLPFSFDVQKD